ncbi:hypothetical protein ARMA_1226 [Ardenticatena maritima]|uniref:DUF2630 family protein n=1 Tax=Ardenticatena maritima TaxID=872965 RepID=A0A0M8K6I0_9CHLR|nr:DUF2630 family protein [Ardenticatena maritima]KPL89046.1 hypothetical protein SE16_00355 [Ardenticatena maritima]GAP62803.1 hypothetical protein ARMA_1226 [Ardenticatena maritima]
MQQSTLDLIQKLSNERQELYRLASQHRLTPEQRQRLQEINRQLPILWDRHRRELAAGQPVSTDRYRPNRAA